MESLTDEQIREMFQDFGLETEERRKALARLGSEPAEAAGPSSQLFIRIVPSTSPEEEKNHAKLAQHS